jgi:hypothetical protein
MLFIQIRDGQPYQHPILEDNFREAFPSIDTGSLPPEFAVFVRLEPGVVPSVYQVLVEEYVWDGDAVRDNWHARPMTEEEKTNKIAEAMAQPHPNGWVFDEEICAWRPDLTAPGTAPDVIG